METIELSTARTIARAIQDPNSPTHARESLEKLDRWLWEADHGLLYMSQETRDLLEMLPTERGR